MKKTTEIDPAGWDALCQRCARCCYEKLDFEGQVYYTDIPCELLDLETNLCTVYADRERRRPGCVRLNEVNVVQGFLPEDCPYVAGIENYPAPLKWEDEETS